MRQASCNRALRSDAMVENSSRPILRGSHGISNEEELVVESSTSGKLLQSSDEWSKPSVESIKSSLSVGPSSKQLVEPHVRMDYVANEAAKTIQHLWRFVSERKAATHGKHRNGYLALSRLPDDVTLREIHLLFSACAGFEEVAISLGAKIAGRPEAWVRFANEKTAMDAMTSRQGTTSSWNDTHTIKIELAHDGLLDVVEAMFKRPEAKPPVSPDSQSTRFGVRSCSPPSTRHRRFWDQAQSKDSLWSRHAKGDTILDNISKAHNAVELEEALENARFQNCQVEDVDALEAKIDQKYNRLAVRRDWGHKDRKTVAMSRLDELLERYRPPNMSLHQWPLSKFKDDEIKSIQTALKSASSIGCEGFLLDEAAECIAFAEKSVIFERKCRSSMASSLPLGELEDLLQIGRSLNADKDILGRVAYTLAVRKRAEAGLGVRTHGRPGSRPRRAVVGVAAPPSTEVSDAFSSLPRRSVKRGQEPRMRMLEESGDGVGGDDAESMGSRASSVFGLEDSDGVEAKRFIAEKRIEHALLNFDAEELKVQILKGVAIGLDAAVIARAKAALADMVRLELGESIEPDEFDQLAPTPRSPAIAAGGSPRGQRANLKCNPRSKKEIADEEKTRQEALARRDQTLQQLLRRVAQRLRPASEEVFENIAHNFLDILEAGAPIGDTRMVQPAKSTLGDIERTCDMCGAELMDDSPTCQQCGASSCPNGSSPTSPSPTRKLQGQQMRHLGSTSVSAATDSTRRFASPRAAKRVPNHAKRTKDENTARMAQHCRVKWGPSNTNMSF
mmetsp:Transcript_28745/g.79157  ORF Transcript_28745/g.79157 Transcript_28745/m.79157 type:complete len:789 (+) Transcript_28745:79-2445(+)